jgi:CheY-like chemotaxis protein
MENQTEPTASPNDYSCPHCGAVNSLAEATWCSCITSQGSLVCKSCGRCFCDAPQAWRNNFWATNSTLLREREGRSASRAIAQPADGNFEVRRPFLLIVDDDKIVRMVTARAFASWPGTVLHAADGQEALQLATELHPDILITDALLPKLDGRELARTLKSNPDTAHCKIIVMTGLYKGRRYRSEALAQFQVDEYLEKPVKPDVLRSIAWKLAGLPPDDEDKAQGGSVETGG